MRVSYPELYVHCKKVLEGCGLPIGCAEEGAEIVAWGEFVGLYGIAQMAEELDVLQASDLSRIQISFEDERLASLDGGGQSSLLSGRIAVDIAFTKALETGLGIVHVKNSRGSDVLIQNAVQAGKRGMSCVIHWMEEDSQTWAMVFSEKNQPYVSKEMLSHRLERKQTDSFLVICSYTVPLSHVVDLMTGNEKKETIKIIRPEQIQALWDEANKQGKEIDVEVWAKLDGVASRVLVEATELSRQRGAGEEAN